MTPLPDNALTALERARQAQERFERRIDVQLRLGSHLVGERKCANPRRCGSDGETCATPGCDWQ